ncbi:hypothetical protein QNI19_19310 [Cytophagaceae bacterium DM2B3-1]|uniref:Lipocalin-like domain-containing protein n=1 Tax=Xanthocytophaga flava TaxID=3048013 RepID=A0ABT7CNJ5_9BACT|nr:hypothetical protein [Xanthocytophaga flavus]MDJ1495096.1 hypothetical protein [Xanthocytophaga flavus]
MKNLRKGILFGLLLWTAVACKDDDKDPQATNLGTYSGTTAVSQDNTGGNLLNTKITITRLDQKATIKISAVPDFEREFTADVTASVETGNTKSYSFTLTQQTAPTGKNVGGTVIVQGNQLSADITIPNDQINAYDTDNKSVQLTGNIKLLAGSFVKE